MKHLAIILFMAGLALGGLAVYVAAQEAEKYKTRLLKLFYYFLLTTNAAMVMNLIYNYLFANIARELSRGVIQGIDMSYRFAVSVLLLFVFAVFISFFRVMNGEEFSRNYKLTLFSIWACLMGYAALNVGALFPGTKMPVHLVVNIFIDKAGMLIVVVELIRSLIKKKGGVDDYQKKILFRLRWGFLLFFLFLLSLLPLEILADFPGDIMPVIAGVVLLLFNLIPLLKMKTTVKKFYGGETEGNGSIISQMISDGKITEKEGEVIQLICEGLTNQEISDRLFLSLQTIKDYNYRIYRKLGVKNRVQLTKKFISAPGE